MSENPSASRTTAGRAWQSDISEPSGDYDREVVRVYTDVLRSSRDERQAFASAVRVYRTRHPAVAEHDARRAIAQMICRKS